MTDSHPITPRPGGMLEGLINHHAGGEIAGELDPEVIAELRRELQAGKFFARDMEALWAMLDLVLTRADRNPGRGKDDLDLLNLACGRCEEGSVLSAYFGRGRRTVRQFALDLREGEIDRGRRRYRATESLFQEAGVPKIRAGGRQASTIEFVADDATRLVGYGEVPERFDVVFIRHQNLWFDRAVWQRIYEFCLARISDGGVLVITSYFDKEHIEALSVLRSLGGIVLASELNAHTRRLDYPGKTVDRHVAVVVAPGSVGIQV